MADEKPSNNNREASDRTGNGSMNSGKKRLKPLCNKLLTKEFPAPPYLFSSQGDSRLHIVFSFPHFIPRPPCKVG